MKRLVLFIAFFYLFLTGCTHLNSKKNEAALPASFDYGKAENGIYSNAYFRIKVHYDTNWHQLSRDEIMNLTEIIDENVAGKNEKLKAFYNASKVKTAYLFLCSKYPANATLEFNPSISLMVENVAMLPSLSSGLEYINQAKKIMAQTNSDYQFGSTQQKQVGKMTFFALTAIPAAIDPTLRQEYWVTIYRDFALCFVMTYKNEEDQKTMHQIIESIEFL